MDMQHNSPLINGHRDIKVCEGGHSYQITSLLAFLDLKDSGSLGRQEKIVFDALRHLGRASDRMIEARTGLDINAVTGRRNELVRKGFIVFDCVDECAVRHNLVKYWRLV